MQPKNPLKNNGLSFIGKYPKEKWSRKTLKTLSKYWSGQQNNQDMCLSVFPVQVEKPVGFVSIFLIGDQTNYDK